MRYRQQHDGEPFTVPKGQTHFIACCDCGLVHKFKFDKEVTITATRDNRRTGQRRRQTPLPLTPIDGEKH